MPTVTETINTYLASREAQGAAANTLRNLRADLAYLERAAGDHPIRAIDQTVLDRVIAEAGARRKPAAVNNLIANHGKFLRWCRTRGLMRPDIDPMADYERRRVMRRERRLIPVTQFQTLLDTASHPRDRAVLAAGLYLFLRQSEIATLRIGDLDLSNHRLLVTVWKTGEQDHMPVCAELDRELRDWLTRYTVECGPLDPDWLLFPAKTTRRHGETIVHTIQPTKRMVKIEDIAKRGLVALGWNLAADDGSSLMDGMHTLRRSGARAAYDTLVDAGYDGALRLVQAMLHHATTTMTERYLGISLDKKRRDERLTGLPMFPGLGDVSHLPVRAVS